MGIVKTIKDIELKGKRIIVRVDFNVPIKNESFRMTQELFLLPSIKYILEEGAKSIVLMSHLGDPKKIQKAKEKQRKQVSLLTKRTISTVNIRWKRPIGTFSKSIGREVKVTDSCIGESVLAAVNSLSGGQILLLENTRFHKEETSENEDREKLGK